MPPLSAVSWGWWRSRTWRRSWAPPHAARWRRRWGPWSSWWRRGPTCASSSTASRTWRGVGPWWRWAPMLTCRASRGKALLAGGRPIGLNEDELTLGFKVAIHSEKAQEPLNRQALELALSEVFGRSFRLKFRVEPEIEPLRGPGTATTATAGDGD